MLHVRYTLWYIYLLSSCKTENVKWSHSRFYRFYGEREGVMINFSFPLWTLKPPLRQSILSSCIVRLPFHKLNVLEFSRSYSENENLIFKLRFSRRRHSSCLRSLMCVQHSYHPTSVFVTITDVAPLFGALTAYLQYQHVFPPHCSCILIRM